MLEKDLTSDDRRKMSWCTYLFIHKFAYYALEILPKVQLSLHLPSRVLWVPRKTELSAPIFLHLAFKECLESIFIIDFIFNFSDHHRSTAWLRQIAPNRHSWIKTWSSRLVITIQSSGRCHLNIIQLVGAGLVCLCQQIRRWCHRFVFWWRGLILYSELTHFAWFEFKFYIN